MGFTFHPSLNHLSVCFLSILHPPNRYCPFHSCIAFLPSVHLSSHSLRTFSLHIFLFITFIICLTLLHSLSSLSLCFHSLSQVHAPSSPPSLHFIILPLLFATPLPILHFTPYICHSTPSSPFPLLITFCSLFCLPFH